MLSYTKPIPNRKRKLLSSASEALNAVDDFFPASKFIPSLALRQNSAISFGSGASSAKVTDGSMPPILRSIESRPMPPFLSLTPFAPLLPISLAVSETGSDSCFRLISSPQSPLIPLAAMFGPSSSARKRRRLNREIRTSAYRKNQTKKNTERNNKSEKG